MAELINNLTDMFQGGLRLGLGVDTGLLVRYLALVALCLFIVWAVAYRTRLRMSLLQRVSMAGLRTLVVLFLILALLDITQTDFKKALAVIFLADVSQSISDEELARTADILAQAVKVRGEAKVRMLTFASAPHKLDDKQEPARQPGAPETNIQKALHLAYDLFPRGYSSRAVILTDGNQTHGDLLGEAEVAVERGVEINFMPLAGRVVKDAYVQSINLPRRARIGEEIQVSALILANHQARADVRLLREGRVLEKLSVQIAPGENWYKFITTAMGQGVTTYSVEVTLDEDADPENNKMSGRVEILDRPRVLLISGNPEADARLVTALTGGGIQVQPAPIEAMPTRIGELNYFDLVLLSDVDPKRLDNEAIDLIESYLRDYGGGLVFIGGNNSSELGKKEKLPLERLLPVNLKEKKKTEPNPIAMALVLDKSNSMGRQNKFGMAIRAAKDAVGELPKKSKIGVVVFDDRPYLSVDMTDVENKDKVFEKLDALGVDGGTSIYPALELAYHKIRRMPNKVRHVILLSDGFSNTRYQQNVRLIEEYRKKKITITTVGLGQECDPKHLRTLAKEGGGEFYHVMDIDQIPRIFIKETKRISRTNIVEKTFTPKLIKKANLISKVDFEKVPELAGYNTSNPKPSSETFILADGEEPLLSRWRVGLGRVVILLTDSGAAWSEKWTQWDQYDLLLTGLVRDTMRDQNFQVFKVGAKYRGEDVEVAVDATDTRGNFLNNLDLEMSVTDPQEQTAKVELHQVRPGGYAGNFPMTGYGSYSIRVTPKVKGRQASQSVSRINIAPPSEFIHTGTNQKLMRRVAAQTDGIYDVTLKEVFRPSAENFPEHKPLWPYLVLLALAFYMINLLLRRT